MIQPQTSLKLRMVSSFMMIGIVFIHAKFIMSRWAEVMDSSSMILEASSIIQYTISEGIARLGVPMFFLISGYLFFKGYDGSTTGYFIKLRKRFKSLVVPYFVWSLLWFLIYYILRSKPIFTFDFLKCVTIEPIPFQFWFLKELIVLIILSPLIYFSISRFGVVVVLVLIVVYLLRLTETRGTIDGILFFAVGGYLSIKRIDEKKIWNRINRVWVALGYCIVLLITIIIWYWQMETIVFLNAFHKIHILMGSLFITIWIFKTDKTNLVENRIFAGNAGVFFFIFAGHEPLQSFVKTFFLDHFTNDISIALGYFIIPTLVIFVLVIAYYSIKKLVPAFLNVLMGYR